jgi:hypothetical protein
MASSPVFAKLNLKGQSEIFVLDAPASFETEIERLDGANVRRELSRAARVSFVLAFVTRQSNVDAFAKRLSKLTPGDPIVWFAYPKRTSKRYKCEIDRDTGWSALGAAGFEPVRMVAIDEDWSAVRFRRVEFIKTLKRSAEHALSKVGKARTSARSK